jgi:hypothetical protein
MYSIKFKPYPHGSENRKDIHMLSADEYKWSIEYPATLDALKEILNENREFIVIWELPLENFPDDGISVTILTAYRYTSPDGYSNLRACTYIAYDCSMYVMNDNGKTIDRVG